MSSAIRKLLLHLLPFVLFLLLWQALAIGVTHFRNVPFPTPWQTTDRLVQLMSGEPLSDALLYRHIADSLQRWLAGFGLAALAGVLYGLAAGLFRRLELATIQIVHLLQLIPGLAWIPIAILIFGVGEPATVFMIVMAAFPPIALSVASGVRHLDGTYLRAARMLGAGKGALFFQILLPASLPATVSGLRLGMGNGWRVLLAAEMVVGTGTGLGYSIVESRWTLDYTAAFACLVVIALFGMLVEYGLFRPLEKRTQRHFQLDRGQQP
ncbi:MAG: ABC transporter permease [Geobacteraceae bacterium]|nr:ABC transporter permease [Geobacteraceae bacterium]